MQYQVQIERKKDSVSIPAPNISTWHIYGLNKRTFSVCGGGIFLWQLQGSKVVVEAEKEDGIHDMWRAVVWLMIDMQIIWAFLWHIRVEIPVILFAQ